MNDHELLLAIQQELDGVEWSTSTLSAVADLLQSNGYIIRDVDDNFAPNNED